MIYFGVYLKQIDHEINKCQWDKIKNATNKNVTLQEM
jgi:hypothetical protein